MQVVQTTSYMFPGSIVLLLHPSSLTTILVWVWAWQSGMHEPDWDGQQTNHALCVMNNWEFGTCIERLFEVLGGS
jgi:hypothetical protein